MLFLTYWSVVLNIKHPVLIKNLFTIYRLLGVTKILSNGFVSPNVWTNFFRRTTNFSITCIIRLGVRINILTSIYTIMSFKVFKFKTWITRPLFLGVNRSLSEQLQCCTESISRFEACLFITVTCAEERLENF